MVTRRNLLRSVGALGAATGASMLGGRTSPAWAQGSAGAGSGATLEVAQAADIVSWDPHVSQTTFFRMINSAIFDDLMSVDPNTLAVAPSLAETVRQPNPVTIDMKLRDGVVFHSGHPMTSADVKYSLERVANPATGSPLRATIATMQSVAAVDKSNIRITLTQPDPGFLTSLHKIRILCAATDATLTKQPNGTGPFRFAEWNPNQNVRLQRFEKYRIPGHPVLGGVNYRVIPEAGARIAALQTGEAHVVILVSFQDVATLGRQPGIVLHPPKALDIGDVLFMNGRRKPLNDVRVRQAVAYAFAKELYVQQFLHEHGIVNMTPHSPANWAHNPGQRHRYSTDLSTAAKLVAEAGYPGGRGLSFDFIFPTGYPEWRSAGEMFENQMRALGATVNVEELQVPVWVQRITQTHQFDLAFNNLGGATLDPSVPYTNGFMFTQGDGGVPGWNDSALASLMLEARVGTQAERKDKYFRIQQQWNDNMYTLILGQKQFFHATRNNVTNWVTHPTYEQSWSDVGIRA